MLHGFLEEKSDTVPNAREELLPEGVIFPEAMTETPSHPTSFPSAAVYLSASSVE